MKGVPPLPRTFHTSSAAVGDCLYVFGGGDKGAEPVKDQQLHVFDTGTSVCHRLCQQRTAHCTGDLPPRFCQPWLQV